MINTIDLHGVRLEELENILDNEIYNARINNISDIKFITGFGIIRKELVNLCTNIYKLDYYIPMSNPGEIIIRIE